MSDWPWPEAPPLALVVDDQETNLRLLGRSLTDAGWDIMPATTALRAMQQLSAALPDVVLLDWHMPVMDGMQMLRQVRANECWARLPVLMLVAEHERTFIEEAFAAGADDVLLKPFQPDELIARASVHAELRRRRLGHA